MLQVKHLNTLGVEQVAAAIHTQGLGLADNAVNAAYRFLARNFMLLSQVCLLCSYAELWKVHLHVWEGHEWMLFLPE